LRPPGGRVEELGLDDDGLLERARNLYAAEIRFADVWIGRLLNKLDDLNLDRDRRCSSSPTTAWRSVSAA
jgi:arylsulfatase A-like enzyme